MRQERPLELLQLPDPVLARVASQLVPGDRASLSVTCRRLLACSAHHSNVWWGVLALELSPKWPRVEQQTRGLAAWLASNRPRVRELAVWSPELFSPPGYLSLPTPPLPDLLSLRLVNQWHKAEQLQALLQYTQLTALTMNHCGLAKRLPREFAAFTALRTLDLSYNRLPGSWEALSGARKGLTSLTARTCALGEVPAVVSTLRQLEILDVGSNRALSGGLHHVQGLSRLTRLNAHGCGFDELPPEVSALCLLRCLDLGDNPRLSGGLQHLKGLTSISTLDLGGCNLAALPPALSTLRQLSSLNLSRNAQLTAGLEHLEALPHLAVLDLHGIAEGWGVVALEGPASFHNPALCQALHGLWHHAYEAAAAKFNPEKDTGPEAYLLMSWGGAALAPEYLDAVRAGLRAHGIPGSLLKSHAAELQALLDQGDSTEAGGKVEAGEEPEEPQGTPDGALECIVCRGAPADRLFALPCGHRVMCQSCANHIIHSHVRAERRCPYCNRQATWGIKLFEDC